MLGTWQQIVFLEMYVLLSKHISAKNWTVSQLYTNLSKLEHNSIISLAARVFNLII